MKTGTNETSSATKAIAHETAARAHEQPPNVKQLKAYQQMADNSRRVQAQAQLQAAANRNAATAQKGPAIVQRTAVYVSFDPAKPPELVPGTTEENSALFFNALRDKTKYTPEKMREIATWMSRPTASKWDKSMAAFLGGGEEEEEDDGGQENVAAPELLSEEEDIIATTTTSTSLPTASESGSDTSDRGEAPSRKRNRSNSSSSKRKKGRSKERQKKKAKVKKKTKDSSEEEEVDAVASGETKEEKKGKAAATPDVEWDIKISAGKLFYDEGGKKWWVKVGAYYYGIMNVAAIAGKLLDGQRATYIKPLQNYGPAAKALKNQFDEWGVLVITIGGAAVSRTLPAEQTEGIIALQETAREAGEKYTADRASGLKTYRPSLLEEKYAVKWKQPALSIKGTTHDRTMIKTMDIRYQPTGARRSLPLEGEALHDALYEPESLHGNGINARFSLVYLDGGELKLATGVTLFFGSGKTTSSVDKKHKKADKIATMLVNSGQIGSVDEYDDGHHAHSEQDMIVYLSKNLGIFDGQLAALAGKTVSIVALVLDMYSNPNTVCEHCHPSLNTFFTTTNWKAKITKRLQAGAGPGVTVSAPDVVIRVSSSKSFSASATAAIPKAKATHTVRQGEHDINFIERTPFNKRHY
ncbi:hypothetical protein [Chitinophaga sp. GbtcB8]|uniref:hypothetical protein n=1 Tax=Chitinophaga sp. GbtcB8 TaxID=2824753 RepID=UPI001C2F198B|nr:hypothetical protein [Chitinophaga sp. GbtcB8]